MAFNNGVERATAVSVYVTTEAVTGTPVLPGASDFLITTEVPEMNQEQNLSDVSAARASRTKVGTVFNRYDYGSGSFTFSSRPSGTAGNRPGNAETAILKAALGKVTDSTTTGASAVAMSAGTQANPSVLTVAAGHVFKKGDVIEIANCTQAEFNGTHIIDSVSGNDLTTQTDASGYAGVATDGDVTLRITRFELGQCVDSLSIWMLHQDCTDGNVLADTGSTLDVLAGVKITSISGEYVKDGEFKYTVNYDYQREYHGGTMLLDATAANAATSLTIKSSETIDGKTVNFDANELAFAGMQFTLVDPAGSAILDSPVTVTSVDSATGLTVGALSVTNGPLPVGTTLAPYLAVGTTTGSILEQRYSTAYLDDNDTDYGTATGELLEAVNLKLITSASFELSQAQDKPLENELNGTDYPSPTMLAGAREISGDVTLVKRIADQSYFESLRNDSYRALAFRAGNVAGSIIDTYLPKNFINTPSRATDASATTLTLSYSAEEPAAGPEEEFKIIYR